MKFLKSYQIFESEVKSKTQLRKELWHKNNPNPEGTLLKPEDLVNYGVPSNIIDIMSEWDVIYKSPYSKSFYSSVDISWSYKPDGSFRVSDHWNFKSSRDGRIHCKTDKEVPPNNNSHFSVGKYNRSKNLYEISLSEPTEAHLQNLSKKEQRLKYLQDPDLIYKKQLFKTAMENGEVLVDINYDGELISGILNRYTGPKIKIVDDKGDVIFTKGFTRSNELDDRKVRSLIFKDRSGKIVDNLFI